MIIRTFLREWGSGECDEYEDKHGAFQMRLPGSPFAPNSVIQPEVNFRDVISNLCLGIFFAMVTCDCKQKKYNSEFFQLKNRIIFVASGGPCEFLSHRWIKLQH